MIRPLLLASLPALLLCAADAHAASASYPPVFGQQVYSGVESATTAASWAETSTSPFGLFSTGAEGYAWDGTYNYTIMPTEIDKRNNDATWSLNLANASATSGLSGNHVGGGQAYNGYIYAPVETFTSCPSTFSNQVIAVYNTSNLALNTSFSTSAQGQETGSLAIAPDQGTEGIIYTGSYCSSGTLEEYDLVTHAYLGSLTLTGTTPLFLQGLTYQSGTLYAAASAPNAGLLPYMPTIYTINPSNGATAVAFAPSIPGETEGLSWKNGTLGLVVNSEEATADTQVHFLTPAGTTYAPSPSSSNSAFSVDPSGYAGWGPLFGQGVGSPFSIFGGVTIGADFYGRQGPHNGLAVSGNVGVGTSAPSQSQLQLVGRQPGVYGGILRLTNLTTTYGTTTSTGYDCFMGPTESSWGVGASHFVMGCGPTPYAPSSADVQWVMANSGDFGFGTTNPTHRVESGGSIWATSYVQASTYSQAGTTTVAALPVCNATTNGAFEGVTDAASPTYLGTLTGGASTHLLAYCNGTNWIAQ